MWYRLYLRVWAHINMVNAYLAQERGEYLLKAEYENEAIRYRSELRRLEILS
jgi:hypothetical protein